MKSISADGNTMTPRPMKRKSTSPFSAHAGAYCCCHQCQLVRARSCAKLTYRCTARCRRRILEWAYRKIRSLRMTYWHQIVWYCRRMVRIIAIRCCVVCVRARGQRSGQRSATSVLFSMLATSIATSAVPVPTSSTLSPASLAASEACRASVHSVNTPSRKRLGVAR